MAPLTCDHCLLTFPEHDAVYEEIDGKGHVFCCNGCRGIFLLIRSEGLDGFYLRRQWKETGMPVRQNRALDIRAFSDDVREKQQSREIDIFIDGIRCASCVWLNERFLSRTEGVEYARINFATHRARIQWNPEITALDKILNRIRTIGYDPQPYRESEQFKLQKAEARDLLVRLGTAAFLSSQLMIYSIALYAGYFQGIDPQLRTILEVIAMAFTVPVILYSGMPFIKNTFRGLRHLHFTMDSLITIGAGSAFVYSIYQMFIGGTVYFDTSAMIITLILLGRYIESTAKGRASETIEKLTELNPKEARVIQADETSEFLLNEAIMVPVASLKNGDHVKVLPGEKIPADGRVTHGESETDESVLTGESKPVLKKTGSEVIGGSINLFGMLIFEVTRTGRDTVLAGIIKAVEDAQSGKPRIQILADRIVGYFVPAILLMAFMTSAAYILNGLPVNSALMTGISVLVIACPCSLGLATPLAVLVFTTMASSRGILIRSGEVIENMSRISHVIFDKTGTITEGRPSLKETIPVDAAISREELVRIAAALEDLSEHSLGKAISAATKSRPLKVTNFKALPGRGIQGTIEGKKIFIGSRAFMLESATVLEYQGSGLDEVSLSHEKAGDTVIYMGWEERVRALFIVSDCLRPEAAETVRMLRGLEKIVSIVSGDNRATTEAIAASAGIGDAVPETSPEGKRDYIRQLQKSGKRILMAGDGINDAPALTEAVVGLAMGRGTDIAMESADAVLVRNDLTLVPYFIELSRRAYAIIRQNIFWAFFYNIVAIPLAVSGVLHPIMAAGAMAASSLFVVLNSLRIRYKIYEPKTIEKGAGA
jgi:Cu2+-exporting ATPase